MNDTPPQDMIDCPYCAEPIRKSAKKCRHCGEIVDAQMRDIENLKREKDSPSVFMNSGSASSASSSSGGSRGGNLVPFRHGLHVILSVLSAGLWIPIYILLFLFRNKNIYR